MTVKEYRLAQGLTQKDLVDELKPIFPSINRTIVSMIETGIIEAPRAVEDYIEDMCRHGKMATQSDEIADNGNLVEVTEASLISGDFETLIYDRLINLPEGGRLTRRDMVLELHIPDRACRRIIEGMRAKGLRICSGGDAPGYYLARSDAEYRAFEREYLSRAYTALRTAKAMRDSYVGQVSFNGREKIILDENNRE